MNKRARKRLIARLVHRYEAGDERVAMSVDEFFTGNTDDASVGGNPDHAGLDTYRQALDRIHQSPRVQGVFLEAAEVPDPDDEDEDDMWVTALRAVVLTDAPTREVVEWVAPLRLRDTWEEPDAVVEDDLLLPGRVRLPDQIGRLRAGVRAVWMDLR